MASVGSPPVRYISSMLSAISIILAQVLGSSGQFIFVRRSVSSMLNGKSGTSLAVLTTVFHSLTH